jgi:hypothetical protein
MRIVLVVLAFACGAACTSTKPVAIEVATPGVNAVRPNVSQTVGGMTLTIKAIAVSDGESQASIDDDEASQNFAESKSIVIVYLEANNTTSATQTLPLVSTSAVVNDEQLDPYLPMSALESDILAGARVDMHAVFLSSRYAASEVRAVRFIMEKSSPGETFDVTVPIE